MFYDLYSGQNLFLYTRSVFQRIAVAGRAKKSKYEGTGTIQTNWGNDTPFIKLTDLKRDKNIENVSDNGIVIVKCKVRG